MNEGRLVPAVDDLRQCARLQTLMDLRDERKVLAPFKTPDPPEETPDLRRPKIPPSGEILAWRAMTAVAAGDRLVRLQTVLHPDADPRIAEEALRIARSLKLPRATSGTASNDIRQLTAGTHRPRPAKPRTFAMAAPQLKPAGAGVSGTTSAIGGAGETEVAISTNGQQILAAATCWLSYSSDGGSSFNYWSVKTGPGAPGTLHGDCSVAWGPSGNFYSTELGTSFVAFYRTNDPIASFPYVTLAVDRRSEQMYTDQPHIAADRWKPSTSGHGDRVYIVWMETAQYVARIACSSDSGTTWGSPVDTNSGDVGYPRVSVGPDGKVYVVSRSGANIVIDKYSDCDAGLAEQLGFPVTIPITDVACPIPGLDRCNNGNWLSSPTIAVDNLTASNVYLGYAESNAALTGQNIVVRQSTDGGETFPTAVIANGNVTAVRFMPWLGAYNGVVYVGWYDRRDATPASNDLTSYYQNSLSGVDGVLTPGTEVNLSGGNNDPQCASGWPCGTRRSGDSTGCSTQPQNAGYCGQGGGENPRCDFASPQCAANQQCITWYGCPKYGDYNGLAVFGGKLVNIWASAIAPPGNDSPGYIAAWTVVTPVP